MITFKKINILSLFLAISMIFSACALEIKDNSNTTSEIYDGLKFNGQDAYTIINDNEPEFNEKQLKAKSYEKYGALDSLGRCTKVIACVGIDIMPTEERGNIGQIKPTGWHTVKYDIVDGKYLYNRCHLIGFQLTGENANEKNLITGTRYLNIEGMLPFENMIADYVKETENHVLYRVTPIFHGDNLLASGVQMEAKSIEDNGEGICFNVYAFNAQPGISIDYATGESRLGDNDKFEKVDKENKEEKDEIKYILNTNSKKIHLPTCKNAKSIKDYNMKHTDESKDELIKQGYEPCKSCNP